MLVGAGGTALCLLLLLLDYRFGPRPGQWLSSAIAILIAVAIGWLMLSGGDFHVWWPLAVLGICLVAGSVGYLERSARGIGWFTGPRSIWILMLVSCLIAANWSAAEWSVGEPAILNQLSPLTIGPPQYSGQSGLTATGRVIPLYRYEMAIDDTEELAYELLRHDLAIADNYPHSVIRLGEPDDHSNCHGFVFASGQYAIRGEDVELILADNCFAPVTAPAAGDVIVYRGRAGKVIHTGVVRIVGGPDSILVESKWGPLGVYLHRADLSPYGVEITYYHCYSGIAGIELPMRRRWCRP
jgi:hypothetical protein